MTTWEVILLVAGFACPCISFFVSRKNDTGSGDNEMAGSSAVWTEKEEQMIKERVGVLLEEQRDEMMEAAQDQMNQLCNDKIMAIDEFSGQLIEKIENNHQEVVFMYNMLNEKEKEVMKTITSSAAMRMDVPDTETVLQEGKGEPESQAGSGTVPEADRAAGHEMKNPVAERTAAMAVDQAAVPQTFGDGNSDSLSQQIQKMYREGKSVLEISKSLNVGQGEVDLIITLYGGTKR